MRSSIETFHSSNKSMISFGPPSLISDGKTKSPGKVVTSKVTKQGRTEPKLELLLSGSNVRAVFKMPQRHSFKNDLYPWISLRLVNLIKLVKFYQKDSYSLKLSSTLPFPAFSVLPQTPMELCVAFFLILSSACYGFSH